MTTIFKFCLSTLLIILLNSFIINAQIQDADLGINGLTCSQCSRSVEMALKKLDFIQKIEMDLQNTHAKISFRKNTNVDLNAISAAVMNAGFSVRSLNITINKEQLVLTDLCFKLRNRNYQLSSAVNKHTKSLQAQVLGKSFLTNAEWKNYEKKLEPSCYNKVDYYLLTK